ncbi:hypothetical protein HC341_17955 [Aquisalimonas sp. 2447]|uniref:hypothetical protein n=1 Tax=Aquisalimonas sp. 2447 TaxID=2740807 RepID=UPI0014324F78|nr:hypothetical protein [Aquisalimonas sp. 2447]QIT56915.1 hypothetical protein HC341_17955 [Aquisalimonas sp. 2447]
MFGGILRLLLGTALALAALAVLLAMVADALPASLFLSMGAYATLFVGMFIALAGILRLTRQKP